MKIHFLGTNGWYDTDTGYTPCTLIDSKDFYLVLDAGGGIWKLGRYIKETKPIYLFLSHLHLDHIWGLHILNNFKFKQGLKIYIPKGYKKSFDVFLNHPFASAPSDLPYKIEVFEVSEGKHKSPFPFEARKLQHVELCFGYRFEVEDKQITYCTDTVVCENDFLLAKAADLLIHESGEGVKKSFAPNSHTNPMQAAEFAKKARVGKLALMHFSANLYTSDADRQEAEKEAKKIFKDTIAARDDLTFDL